jgi:hypothetical protein
MGRSGFDCDLPNTNQYVLKLHGVITKHSVLNLITQPTTTLALIQYQLCVSNLAPLCL